MVEPDGNDSMTLACQSNGNEATKNDWLDLK